jgi:hypothetical protein
MLPALCTLVSEAHLALATNTQATLQWVSPVPGRCRLGVLRMHGSEFHWNVVNTICMMVIARTCPRWQARYGRSANCSGRSTSRLPRGRAKWFPAPPSSSPPPAGRSRTARSDIGRTGKLRLGPCDENNIQNLTLPNPFWRHLWRYLLSAPTGEAKCCSALVPICISRTVFAFLMTCSS